MGNAGVVNAEEIQKEYGNLLAENEHVEIGFQLIRDMFIFTNKRLLLVDKQGLTGKKQISYPYYTKAYPDLVLKPQDI